MHGPESSRELDDLSRLDRDNIRRDRASCKICHGPADLFDVVDFNKVCSESDFYAFGLSGIRVFYRRCSDCGFLYTEFFDSWKREHFARWIYNADYALVDSEYQEVRPSRFSREVAARLRGLESIAILDYGSGAGIFSEQMRGLGFAATKEFDPFSSPQRPPELFDLLTCFEVMEHSPYPLATLRDMLAFLRPGGCILFSQTLQPANIETIRANWWYAAPRNGHLSLYTTDALAQLARSAGMLFCEGNGLFLFRGTQTSPVTERLCAEFGPALVPLCLNSPGSEYTQPKSKLTAAQWHGLETDIRGAFRWSARATITWPLAPAPIYPCELLVRIPLFMIAYPSILEGVTLRAGPQSSPASVSTDIRGRIAIKDSSIREVLLCSGEPRSPAAMRGESDQRLLGLAVWAASSA